jgi:tRNA (cmo5U34)-methyltransferase
MSHQDKSIAAYDNLGRVKSYDADMDLMHPNRPRMVDVMLDVLAAAEHKPTTVLDLGSGTGFLLQRLLVRFPGIRVVAVDGARSMLDLARARLGDLAARVEYRIGDFRTLAELCRDIASFDAVTSSFALHHLDPEAKATLFRTVHDLIHAGGWFLNGDVILAEDDGLEALIQRMRVQGIVRRAAGRDQRFLDEARTAAFLQDMEKNEGDQPQKLASDLESMAHAGFEHVAVLWRETREVVTGGMKSRVG